MTDGWALVDHACRHCGGRIVERGGLYRCSGCGVESRGRPDGICGCGLQAPREGRGRGHFHCGRNPERSPKSPHEIVVLFGEPEPEAPRARRRPAARPAHPDQAAMPLDPSPPAAEQNAC